jgi:hypothetical protein
LEPEPEPAPLKIVTVPQHSLWVIFPTRIRIRIQQTKKSMQIRIWIHITGENNIYKKCKEERKRYERIIKRYDRKESITRT